MTAPTLASKTADAFNRHGKFTARVIENDLAVELRYIDTGNIAATVWTPFAGEPWMWSTDRAVRPTSRPAHLAVEEIVGIVALYVLDAVVKR